MKSKKRESERAGKKVSIAAVMGMAIGLIAGVSLSHSTVTAQTALKSEPAASAAQSSPMADASACNDVCDVQLD